MTGKIPSDKVACEEMVLSFRTLFSAEGFPINAAGILPGLLQKYGDVGDVLAQIAPRKILLAAGIGEIPRSGANLQMIPGRFDTEPRRLTEWMGD
jgi:hypothetical protein